ncbi:hypothetical protein FB451DRAFT_1187849 [Mycena latifolia]|nr:hypothetical protein FB451DRAFT_1187849 [Mycena latifolia]
MSRLWRVQNAVESERSNLMFTLSDRRDVLLNRWGRAGPRVAVLGRNSRNLHPPTIYEQIEVGMHRGRGQEICTVGAPGASGSSHEERAFASGGYGGPQRQSLAETHSSRKAVRVEIDANVEWPPMSRTASGTKGEWWVVQRPGEAIVTAYHRRLTRLAATGNGSAEFHPGSTGERATSCRIVTRTSSGRFSTGGWGLRSMYGLHNRTRYLPRRGFNGGSNFLLTQIEVLRIFNQNGDKELVPIQSGEVYLLSHNWETFKTEASIAMFQRLKHTLEIHQTTRTKNFESSGMQWDTPSTETKASVELEDRHKWCRRHVGKA